MINKVVLSGLIAANGGKSGKGDGASDLEPGIILAGADESGCLTNTRTLFFSVYLKKLIVRVSVLDVSRKDITLETI